MVRSICRPQPLLAAALALAGTSPGQDLARIRALLGSSPDNVVVIVVDGERTLLRYAPKGDHPDPLPLADLSPVVVMHLLTAGESGWSLEEPMVADGGSELEFGRIETWTWGFALRPWLSTIDAYRFLEPASRRGPRPAGEFAAVHAMPWFAEDVRRLAPPGLAPYRSHVGMALVQNAIERRTRTTFAAWAESTAEALGLPSLTVGGPALEGVPDAEIDAAFDLRLSLDDVERLLRIQGRDGAPRSTFSYRFDTGDEGPGFYDRTTRAPGVVRAALMLLESSSLVAFSWTNDPEVDFGELTDAILQDLTGRPTDRFVSLGGGSGDFYRRFEPRDGVWRATIPSVDTELIDLELTWRPLGAVVRVLPDDSLVGLGRELRLAPGLARLEGEATLALALEETGAGYRGIALVVVPERSWLPYSVTFTKVD